MIRPIKRIIRLATDNPYQYATEDDLVWDTLQEAIEHETRLKQGTKVEKDPTVYEQVWTVQEAINKAVAEHRPVRFLTNKSNAELKKEIVDLKGCKLRKPDKDSNEVAVLPGDLAESFDFNEVDTKVVINT